MFGSKQSMQGYILTYSTFSREDPSQLWIPSRGELVHFDQMSGTKWHRILSDGADVLYNDE